MQTRHLLVLIPMAVGISACQTHATPPKSFALGAVQAEALGAQHRVVYSIPRYQPGTDKAAPPKGQPPAASEDPAVSPADNTLAASYSAFCAEPSPDAMNALASSLGLNLQAEDKLKLGMSVAQNISSTNIGLRTAAIQALRDITYRNCEGFANGAISPIGLETLQRRFQSTMVSILAIEQLTGAVTPPTVALTGKAEAMDTADYATLASLVDKKETEVTTLTTARDNAKTKYDTEKAKENNQEATGNAESDLKQAQDAMDKAKAELESLKTAMTNLIPSSHASSQTLAANIGNGGGSRVSDATIEKLAATVQQITKDTLVLGFGREVCTSILGRSAGQSVDSEDIGLELMTNQLKAANQRIDKESARLKKEKGADYVLDNDPVLKSLMARQTNLAQRIADGQTFVNPVVQSCIILLQEDISTAQANINNANLYATKYWELMTAFTGKLRQNLSAADYANVVAALNGSGAAGVEAPEEAPPAMKVADPMKPAVPKKPAAPKKPVATAPAATPAAAAAGDGKAGRGPLPPIVLDPLNKSPAKL
ncbi:hypothetical protein EV700_0935 [Fluviicoccus keumensis]|uniref:Outer membrane efflux protein n=1 Tax=Fluviicoccus keumensis TaxID=1435465 RepID=A0A4V2G6B0_9GAMM|nr:hypothetical protein [Fluviicoccus keumensis]RZU47966.1 hypothetical protein EV700_0935 [Fluviicoccus keumensis]